MKYTVKMDYNNTFYFEGASLGTRGHRAAVIKKTILSFPYCVWTVCFHSHLLATFILLLVTVDTHCE